MRKPVYAICEQQRRRSACTSALSDQHLCCSLSRQYNTSTCYIRNFKILASFCGCAGQFEPTLVAHPEDRFSRDKAHLFSDGFFTWTDGSSPRYINWDSKEPSDLNGTRHEDCVEMRHENGKWNDQRCFSYNGYVCKTAKCKFC